MPSFTEGPTANSEITCDAVQCMMSKFVLLGADQVLLVGGMVFLGGKKIVQQKVLKK